MSKIAVIGIIGNSVFLPVEKFHEGGETVEASSVHFEIGGKGFNQAVAAARCGAEVSFLGAVGKEYREDFKRFFEKEGIKATLCYKDGSTAFAAILTDRAGVNRVTVHQGAELCERDVDAFADAIAGADMLLLNNEVPREVNERAVELAHKNNVRVILNPAPARGYPEDFLDKIYLFTPNEFEEEGIENRDNVIMTLGERGCLIKSLDEIIPARAYGRVVDTTGAGDTFNGVLCALLADGHRIDECARAACAVASLEVTGKYALSSIPSASEIEKIIKEII